MIVGLAAALETARAAGSGSLDEGKLAPSQDAELIARCLQGDNAAWEQAVAALTAKSNEDLSDSFDRARDAPDVEGEVVDCDIRYRPRRQLVCRVRDPSGELVLRFLNLRP